MCIRIGDFMWTLVTEQERTEAFGAISALKKVSVFTGFVVLFFVVLVAVSVSKSISKPIEVLQKGTEIIGNGNLDHKVGTDAKDEIGGLSRAFDRMTEELKRTVKRLGDIMEIAPVGIAITSQEERGELFDANSTLLKILGYESNEEFLNLPSSAHYADPKDRERLVELREKGPVLDYEVELKRKDGSLFTGSINSLTIPTEEGENQVISVVQDVTVRKQAEEKLNQFAEELEWKNLSLEQAKAEAEEATKLKEKFVSLVAHDLKAPLSSIIGFLNLLYTDDDHPLDKEQKTMFEIVLNSANNMVKMINDLLEISRLQSGRISLNPGFIDGHSIGKLVVQQLDFLAKEKSIELGNEVPPGTRLYADYDLFFGVIQNLVSNAVKFCKKGDRITLFAPQDPKTAIAVKDTGAGISDKILPDLFKHEIKTSTPGTAGEKGTGFGLPFAYEIMKAHGGSLTVESKVGKGSVFYAELPYERPRILVVEDEREARLLFKKRLEKIDVDIVEAENGEEALAVLKETDIHLVIADIRMPVMDGLEMLELAKKDPKTELIPIILITSKGLEPKEKALRLGANDFVTKPVNMGNFVKKVRRFVQ